MLAVTTRPAIRARLRAVSVALGLPRPVFIERVDGVLEAGVDRAVLFLDLGNCATDVALGHVVQIWQAFHPGSQVILFVPLLNREVELRTAVSLVRGAHSAELCVMTVGDFYRDEVWRALSAARERIAHEAELRRDLLTVIRETGRPLRAEPLVLELLHQAARHPNIGRAAATPPEVVPLTADGERKRRWKLLRRSGQLPASWLLVVFRVVWYLKLRQQGWDPKQIAAFLGFPSSRHLRRAIARPLSITMDELKQVRYRDALHWAATLLTSSHLRPGELTLRALIRPLLETSDAAAIPRAARGLRRAIKQSRQRGPEPDGDPLARQEGPHAER